MTAKHRQAAHEHGQICDTCGGRAVLITKGTPEGLLILQCQRGSCGREFIVDTDREIVRQAQKALFDYIDAARRDPEGWEDLQLKGAARRAQKAKARAEKANAWERLCIILDVKGS